MNPIFPSILSTNFFDLQEKLYQLNSAGIDFLHLDIMDGHFVNNISFGPSMLRAVSKKYPFRFDAHLMVSNPEKMIPIFIEAGADWISFHMETQNQVENKISLIKSGGKKAGLVLNPDSSIQTVFQYLKGIDFVLLMSVFPGFGGQKFIAATLERIAALRSEISRQKLKCQIQVDGGVNLANIPDIKKAGADIFVIGTFLYNSSDIKQTTTNILAEIQGVKI